MSPLADQTRLATCPICLARYQPGLARSRQCSFCRELLALAEEGLHWYGDQVTKPAGSALWEIE